MTFHLISWNILKLHTIKTKSVNLRDVIHQICDFQSILDNKRACMVNNVLLTLCYANFDAHNTNKTLNNVALIENL